MSRSFAGGVLKEVALIAERIIPLMDDCTLAQEQIVFGPAFELRAALLALEAEFIASSPKTGRIHGPDDYSFPDHPASRCA